MQIHSFGISDRGIIRDANEDHFLVNEKNGIFLVADGMGGLSNGNLASKIAIDTIEYFIKHSKKDDITWPIEPDDHYSIEENRFLAAIFLANQRIYEYAQNNPELGRMGTTLTGFIVDREDMIVANVGDSRVYLINNEAISQLTRDHTLVMEEVRKGNLTLEEARVHPKKHIITRAVGTSNSTQVDIHTTRLKKTGFYLICSDGLTDMVSDEDILSIIRSNRGRSLNELGRSLIATAIENGGRDNITVVLLHFSE